jgi:hypothetical protein
MSSSNEQVTAEKVEQVTAEKVEEVAAKKVWRRPQWRARNVRTHC